MTSAQSHYLIEWKLEKVVSINPGVRRSKMDFCICQLLANLNGTAVNKKMVQFHNQLGRQILAAAMPL